jgi:hypothetical protein
MAYVYITGINSLKLYVTLPRDTSIEFVKWFILFLYIYLFTINFTKLFQ